MNDGKIVLEGEVKLLSPLHIGSGKDELTDLDIIKDSNGKPFITFTSFVGALKHYLIENYLIGKSELDKLFGFAKDEGSQGSVIMGTDSFLVANSKNNVITRDGIKINLSNGLVEEGAKYDYQIVDTGSIFSFKLETSYSSNTLPKATVLQYYSTIIEMLKENDSNCHLTGLRIGAKTNNGLGKIQLINEKLYDYDFGNYKNVIAWLKREYPPSVIIKDVNPFERMENDLIIDVYLDLKSSFIQRNYNDDPSMPDSTHIQSDNKNILSGSGTKGAITTRAKKIINTIWDENLKIQKDKFIKSLFGFVNNDNPEEEPIKARFHIEERELPDYVAELQTRIKIDRFTGGTINGALFDSMPLFNTKELSENQDLINKTRITFQVNNCSEDEFGLMLLVLKDLWTGDIAIGGEKGIGRGVFNGVTAFIKYKKQTTVLKQGLEELINLQKYVDALNEKARGGK